MSGTVNSRSKVEGWSKKDPRGRKSARVFFQTKNKTFEELRDVVIPFYRRRLKIEIYYRYRQRKDSAEHIAKLKEENWRLRRQISEITAKVSLEHVKMAQSNIEHLYMLPMVIWFCQLRKLWPESVSILLFLKTNESGYNTADIGRILNVGRRKKFFYVLKWMVERDLIFVQRVNNQKIYTLTMNGLNVVKQLKKKFKDYRIGANV